MKPKIYATEKIAKVAKTLNEAPPLPPKFLPHAETLSELSKPIKELHFKKNYDAREITRMLRQGGIKATLREVKNVLGTATTVTPRNVAKSTKSK